MNPIVVIPARMASTRLPGKPLADINGRPMILHMLDRGREAGIGPVAVACADTAIAEAVRAAGGRAVLTDPALPSGSDRVHAALAELDPERRHDVVVNLQGDFPTLDRQRLAPGGHPLADPAIDIGTLVVPIRTRPRRRRAPGQGGLRLRPSRAHRAGAVFLPPANPLGPGPRWHHVGIYAYRRAALARFVALPPSPLEQREKLEQLRALEDGMRIACVRVEHGPFGVDTPEDLERARAGSQAPAGTRMSGSPSRASPAPIPTWPAAPPIPGMTTLPCQTFQAAIEAVREGRGGAGACCRARTAWRAGCPTSTQLLPDPGCIIVGEQFQRVEHCLLACRAPRSPTSSGRTRTPSRSARCGASCATRG